LDSGASFIGRSFGGEILLAIVAHRAREKETGAGRKKLAKFSLLTVSTNACASFLLLLDGEVTKRFFWKYLGASPSKSLLLQSWSTLGPEETRDTPCKKRRE
jgi:hypothetical protein